VQIYRAFILVVGPTQSLEVSEMILVQMGGLVRVETCWGRQEIAGKGAGESKNLAPLRLELVSSV